MVPIVKDSVGDASDVNNYRGITLSPVISSCLNIVLWRSFMNLL